MKVPADAVVITVAIHDHDVFLNVIPPASAGMSPYCEVLDMAALPSDVMAYIDQIARTEKGAQ